MKSEFITEGLPAGYRIEKCNESCFFVQRDYGYGGFERAMGAAFSYETLRGARRFIALNEKKRQANAPVKAEQLTGNE